jgi:VCBS repeat-containing protein
MADIFGTADRDFITGTADDDVIYGLDGDDLLFGYAGDDTLYGGEGSDQLYGGSGTDNLFGGDGRDILIDEGGLNNTLDGGDGDDNIWIWSGGGNTLLGGGGTDNIRGAPGDYIDGGDGDDIIYYFVGSTVLGGSGDDRLTIDPGSLASDPSSTISTGTGTDRLIADVRLFFRQPDVVTDFTPGDGGDIIEFPYLANFPTYTGGNLFRDGYIRLRQDGSDALVQFDLDGANGSGAAATLLILQNVDATALTAFNFNGYAIDGSLPTEYHVTNGTSNDDQISGTIGNDEVYGFGGDDYIIDNDGDDIISGGEGNDLISGGWGQDILDGGAGDDTIGGGPGADTLIGGDGGDNITVLGKGSECFGGSGNDVITIFEDSVSYGGDGDDSFFVNINIDQVSVSLTGGSGHDYFALNPFYNFKGSSITITDFTAGAGGDVINVNRWIDPFVDGNLILTQRGADAVLQMDLDGATGQEGPFTLVILQNVDANQLTAYNLDGTQPIVTIPNEAPTLPATASLTLSEDESSGPVAIGAVDADGDTLTYALKDGAGPISGEVSFADGSFTYTPFANLNGADSFTIVVSDGNGGSAEQVVSVTLTPVNDAATITGATTGSVTEAGGTGNALPGTPAASGVLSVSDVDAGESTFAAPAPAALAGTYGAFTFDAATGQWAYALDNARAATQALAAGQQVTETLTLASLDGTASSTVTVTVTGANDAATIGGAVTGSVTEAVGLSGTSQASGALTIADPDSPAQFQAGAFAGAYGTLTLGAAGAWTYALDNANATVNALGAGQTLTDSVTVASADGTTRAIAITITGVDDANVPTAGNDVLTGTAGNDTISGLAGNDTISGLGGDDVIEGGAGNDTMDGGAGIDTASYAGATGAVSVSLAITGTQNTGGAGRDSLVNFENLLGSAFADTLTGNALANAINGGLGGDTITGGGGADRLTGGGGADIFAYAALADSAPVAADLITDFVHLQDRIDLSAIDANIAAKGGKNDTFLWGGATATSFGVWFAYDAARNVTKVSADVDGNVATVDLLIELAGNVALTAADFVL